MDEVKSAHFPAPLEVNPNFYNATDGGDTGQGRMLNPVTGQPHPDQWVPRGDYTRVLAKFWADGPTPRRRRVTVHFTVSRAAAEVLTLLTGDEYFPESKSSFSVKANEFLEFEEGRAST